MAIGKGWVNGAWQDAAFVTDAWESGDSFDNAAFDPAAFSTTSFELTESGTNVAATTDALVLTEYVTSIDIDIKGTADALALATYAANIALDIKATTDALVLTEYVASIDIDIKGTIAALSIATFDANIGLDVKAVTDALTLTEYAADIDLDIKAGVAALTLTEYTATLGFGVSFDNVSFDEANAFSITSFNIESGSTPTEIDATTDALVLTEYAANIGINVQAKVYASELVTLATNINAATGVDANVDALSVATYQAQITNFVISFDSTSFDEPNSFDRNAFSIYAEVDTEVGATTDALVLTENTATVALDKYVDQLTTPSLTVTEYVAAIGYVVSATISFENGSFDEPNAFSINSFSIEVDLEGVAANTAALTLTEYPATIFADREISANTDALILATYPAQLDQDTNVSTVVDGLVLTSYQANVSNKGDIMAGSKTLSINENKASVSVGVQGSGDTLVVATYQTTVGFAKEILANTDGLVVANNVATITLDTGVSVGASTDQLTLATYSATARYDKVVEANTDALVITTLTQDVGLDLRVLAGFDSLIVTTYPVDTPIFTPNIRAVKVGLRLRAYPLASLIKPGGAGGVSEGERRERLKKREEAKKLREKRNKELADRIFGDSAPAVKKLITEGKAEILGNEVEVEPLRIPVYPIDELAPQLNQIKDEMDREIAELIRAQEETAYQKQLAEFQLKVQRYEEELMAFLILALDD